MSRGNRVNVKITFTTWNVVVWESVFLLKYQIVFSDGQESTDRLFSERGALLNQTHFCVWKYTFFTKFKVIGKIKFLYFLEFGSIFFLLFGMSDKNVPILVSGAFRFNSIFHSIIGWLRVLLCDISQMEL